MTSPTSEGQHSGLDSFFSAVRGIGIRRRTDNKWVGGVCSGIADRLRVDPVVVRAGLILLIIFGGVGIAAYLVAWVLLPDAENRIAAERALRDGDGRSIVLLVIATIALLSSFPWWFGDHSGAWGFPWGLILVGAIVWMVVHRSRTGTGAGARQAFPAGAPAPGSPADPGTAPGSQERTDQTGTWAHQAGEPAGGGGNQAGERAGAWGNQAGERAGAWRNQVGERHRARRRSGGILMTLIGAGLAMVAYGATLWLSDSLGLSGDHHVIALAGALAALGLLVLGLGVAGWRAGFLGFVAVCTAIATLAAGAFPHGPRWAARVHDATWAPTVSDVTSARSYDLGIGDGRLDLRNLPVDGAATTPTIAAQVGLGDLTILVPSGMTLGLQGHVGLGEIRVRDSGGTRSWHGTDVSRTETEGTGPADVTVDANVGVGQITVVKE